MVNRRGNNGNIDRLNFLDYKSLQMATAAMKLKDTAPWEKNYIQHSQHIKKQYFSN